jgi:hypothetical protein
MTLCPLAGSPPAPPRAARTRRVIGGHVDSDTGPVIFYRLGELRPGAWVQVAKQWRHRHIRRPPGPDVREDRIPHPRRLRNHRQGRTPPHPLQRRVRPRRGLPQQHRRLRASRAWAMASTCRPGGRPRVGGRGVRRPCRRRQASLPSWPLRVRGLWWPVGRQGSTSSSRSNSGRPGLVRRQAAGGEGASPQAVRRTSINDRHLP